MLSALPKIADRNFVIGFFLPSLLFTIAGLAVFSDHARVRSLIEALTAKDLQEAAFLLVAVWVLSVLMLTVNHPLYRLLEGYSWPFSRLARTRERYKERLRLAQEERRTLYSRWMAEGDGFGQADINRYGKLSIDLANTLPSRETDVMPTAFGNAIKAFEIYSRDVYGADAPPIWLRLAAVVPKTTIDQIQEVRTQVDFLINCCFFAALVGVLALGKALWIVPWSVVSRVWSVVSLDIVRGFPWMLFGGSLLAFLAAWGFYHWAVARVPAWGQLVMATFDCYLPALAKQLGFQLPAKGDERIAFWTAFSRMLVYRRDPAGTLPFRPEEWEAATDGQIGGKTKGGVEDAGRKGEPDEDNSDEETDR